MLDVFVFVRILPIVYGDCREYMISKKTKYALSALVYLAKHEHSEPVLISVMAESEKIPKKFLEVILLDLKNQGFLQSKRGKGGGYLLAKPPAQIVLGQIVRLFDGPLAPVSCVSQTAYQKCSECKDEATCGIRLIMKDVRDAIANVLDKTSLADVLDRMVKLKGKASFDYFI